MTQVGVCRSAVGECEVVTVCLLSSRLAPAGLSDLAPSRGGSDPRVGGPAAPGNELDGTGRDPAAANGSVCPSDGDQPAEQQQQQQPDRAAGGQSGRPPIQRGLMIT